MVQRRDKAESIRDLFSAVLGMTDIAFVYLGYSGVVLRMRRGMVAFDVADLFKADEVNSGSESVTN